ncbi:MAG: hypothetical protein ABW034_13530 [Steroidobacteraceae bacterium]
MKPNATGPFAQKVQSLLRAIEVDEAVQRLSDRGQVPIAVAGPTAGRGLRWQWNQPPPLPL